MKKFTLFFTLLTIYSNATHDIDENYAKEIAKKYISEPISVQILKGGFSGTPLFTITSETKKYVIRFLGNKTFARIKQEIDCLNVASCAGYGPLVYFFDAEKAFVIMEYLPNQKISQKNLYTNLADLLQKIHNGPQYGDTGNFFDLVRGRNINAIKETLKIKNINYIPLAKLEKILDIIQETFAKNITKAPCHNDLQPNNLIFSGNEFKAIDYEHASVGNPYLDLATVAIYYCFDQASEDMFLSTYLKHKPSFKDKAQLYLMKQFIWLRYALVNLRQASQKLEQYETLQIPSYEEFLIKIIENKQYLQDLENKLKFAKILINKVITNFESQEFNNAVNLLNETEK